MRSNQAESNGTKLAEAEQRWINHGSISPWGSSMRLCAFTLMYYAVSVLTIDGWKQTEHSPGRMSGYFPQLEARGSHRKWNPEYLTCGLGQDLYGTAFTA